MEAAVSPRAKRQASAAVRTSPARFLAHTQLTVPAAASPKAVAAFAVVTRLSPSKVTRGTRRAAPPALRIRPLAQCLAPRRSRRSLPQAAVSRS